MTDPSFSWTISFKEFAHPAGDRFSAIGTIGPTFFLAIAMFSFVFQIGSLATEKELKLRQVISSLALHPLLVDSRQCDIFAYLVVCFIICRQ